MKRARRSTSSLPASARVWSGLLVLLLGTLAVLAAPPAWWTERSVLTTQPADDYAAANLGQLKAIASKAAAELNARLPGGAGPTINNLIASWSAAPAAGVTRDDYAALNLGQLKAVAQPFYDRLIATGYATQYPWTGSPNPPNDFALANLGQLKHLFRFDLRSVDAAHDTDQNGLPDWWERHYFGQIGVNPNGDADGDGINNSAELQSGTDPLSADTDNDGLPDGWETAFNFDPLMANDPNADPDGDGLSNLAESRLWRNPNKGAIVGTAATVALEIFTTLR